MEVDLNELERLAKAATPGPWDLEPIRSEGCYGSGPNCSTGFDSYEIRADGSVLLDALNSDAALVSEDWDGGALYAWDEIGQRNLSFIAAANPVVVLELVRRLRESEARVAELESELRDDHWPNGATVKLRWADGGYYRKHGWAKRDADGHLVTAYSGDRLDESMWVVVQERKVQPTKNED